MKKKTLRAILVTLGLLLIAFVVVLMGGSPANRAVVASTPAYETQSVDAQAENETIADSEVPLAAPQTIETVQLTVNPVQEAAPAAEEPVAQAPEANEPVSEEPVSEEPVSEEPVVVTSAAIRLLERANALLAQYNAYTTMAEKRALLEASNNSLGNDAIRTKLLADLGGSWEQLEAEVVAATEYQQGKTLHVQVYMSGISSGYVPVVYTTQNADRSGNQWATNLVYNDETATWMEYTQKHAYNDSRVGFYMTPLKDNEDGWEELKETMEESPVWQPVEVPAADEAPAGAEG
ncbi:MAG: hypothetical protein Q8S22_12235 [Eubacteriales bacterium]|jgi:hypothetical protein|nr:hypothetical protein [Eubacteriales bacterium]